MSRDTERRQSTGLPESSVSCRRRCVLQVPLALLTLGCLNVQPCAALSLHAIAQRRSSGTVVEAPRPRAKQIRLCEEPCDIDEHCIYFVTGNPRKEMEVNAILAETDIAPFRVSHIDIDLPELQGDAEAICREKAAAAAARVGGSVIVEDTSLCFSALNGLPGPYIKWFVESLGNEGLYRLLSDYEDKSAYCQCIVGFSTGPGAEPHLFTGRTPGFIVAPTDAGGFGWDAVFVPDGADVTFSKMDMAQKNKISHRAKALSQFIEFCRDNADEIVSAAQNADAPRDAA